jgi:phosphatidylinositol alpha-1,6-mannosyltransferase
MPCRTRRRGLDVEGLGIVYLEASATALPVVAGDSGGAPDAVLAGETGWVVRDGPTAIVDTVERLSELLGDPVLRTGMGERGRKWVQEDWSWERQVGRLRRLAEISS